MGEVAISLGAELADGLRLAGGRMLGCGMDASNQEQSVERATHEHIAALDARTCPRSDFDRALLFYLDLLPRSGRDGMRDGRRAAMIRAFDNRATWIMIRHWRRGTGRAPQWAKDLLLWKTNQRIHALTTGRDLLSA